MLRCIVVLAFLATLSMFACSDRGTTVVTTGSDAVKSDDGPPAGVFAVPQEELVRTPDAIKLTGVITVNGYSTGLLQIDATLPVQGSVVPPQGIPPITVARFKSPGPFEMYLPPKTEDVNLALILDLKGNGPDAEDPKLVYSGNPVHIGGESVSGVEMTIDSSSVALPPVDPADQPEGAEPPGADATISDEKPESPAPAAQEAPANPSGASPGTGTVSTEGDALSRMKAAAEKAAADKGTSASAGTDEASKTDPADDAVPPGVDPLDESLDTVPRK